MGVLRMTLPTRVGGGDCWESTPCGPLGLGPDGKGIRVFYCISINTRCSLVYESGGSTM